MKEVFFVEGCLDRLELARGLREIERIHDARCAHVGVMEGGQVEGLLDEL